MNISLFTIGREYTRRSLGDLLNDSRITISREGLFYLPNDTFLFVTLEKSNKPPEHHYNDYFEKDHFHWDSQN